MWVYIFSLFMILNVPIVRWLWKQFFDDMDHFLECLHYLWQWDLLSAWKGEYWYDVNMSMKIKFFFSLVGVIILLEYIGSVKLEALLS